MNIRRLYKVLFVLPVALLAGCADFLDVNDTPNNPLEVPQSTILPSALVATGFANANELNRFYSTVSDYLYGAAGSPSAYDTYVLTGGDFGNQWTGELWNGALIQYDRMIKKGEAEGSYAYVGIAKIMQAYTWSLVTDTWGDIPYSQALRGDENITRPELDTQEDIYKGNAAKGVKSLFDLTREGIADLDKSSIVVPGVDDVVYGGNLANWKRAGYTLMLRMAMTISGKEPALAASVINEVIASNNYITTNAQNLAVKFGGVVGSQSPIYSYMFVTTFQNDMTVSSRYVNLLNASGDPRLPLFVKKGVTAAGGSTPTPGYVTFENGFRGTLPGVFQFAKWNTAVTGANGVGPIRLVTNAGRAFMLAEAILKVPGVNPQGLNAQSLFYEGIRASLTEAGATTAEINAFTGATLATATPIATLSADPNVAQDQIITQKYIAMTGNGLDAWIDIRRTGFPSHTAVEHANAAGEDGKRPVRARYPDSDIARNPNLGAAVKRTNEKVWWDNN